MTSQQPYAGYWTSPCCNSTLQQAYCALLQHPLQAETLCGRTLLYVSCADVVFLKNQSSSSQALKVRVMEH